MAATSALHALSGVLLALLFTAPSMAASDAVRIGEINPLTGKLAMHGMEIHQGILYAVEEVNSRGGLGGHPVELISRDDQSQPEVAINQTQELLLREKVVGLVGGYVDSMVGPISELAAKQPRSLCRLSQPATGAHPRSEESLLLSGGAIGWNHRPPLSIYRARLAARNVSPFSYAATPGSTEFGGDLLMSGTSG